MKTVFPGTGILIYEDDTVARSSPFYNGNLHTGNRASLYWETNPRQWHGPLSLGNPYPECTPSHYHQNVHHVIIIIVQTYLKTLNLLNACQIYFVERMSKIEHIFPVIYCTLYGAVCFQFTHFPYDDWVDIHFVLLSSWNRKYELSSIV